MPDFLAQCFLGTAPQTEAVRSLTVSFIIAAAFFQCFDVVQAIANGALRGIKDTFVPMLLSIRCYWLLGFCSAYCFAFYFHRGPLGIWYGLTVGITSAGIALLSRFYLKIKNNSLRVF